ncbi:MAG: hypothetical protein AAGJ37_01540 [Pseudomonadota bacterium]
MLLVAGCAHTPPRQIENICHIFEEKRRWYSAAEDMRDEWGVPIHVPMAMMYQESTFRHNAKPPRDYIFFGLIPWGRVSSAYGFAQAKTGTWDDYRRETGNRFADRDRFEDAIDFMGWYISKTHRLNKISKWDAGSQYLNYHEGWGGYRSKSYASKDWLKRVSYRVDERARRYAAQLNGCEKDLQKGWFMRLFT